MKKILNIALFISLLSVYHTAFSEQTVTLETLEAGKDYYWVGGSGSWAHLTHWSAESGGVANLQVVPGVNDNIFFDENSFKGDTSCTVEINVDIRACQNMSWIGAKNHPSFFGDNKLRIYGSLTLIPEMNWSITGNVEFEAMEVGKTITLAGQKLNAVYFNGVGGSWDFLDEFYSSVIFQYNGIINTNSNIVNCSQYIGYKGELNLANSIMNIYQHSWLSKQNVTINAGTSTINFTNNSSQSLTCYEQTFHNINFLKDGGVILGTGNIHFNDVFFEKNGHITPNSRTSSNAIFNNVLFSDYATISPNIISTFNKATFLNRATIHSNNTYNNLIFTAGYEYLLEPNTIQTINEKFDAIGECENYIFIHSSKTNSQATIRKQSGTINCDYLVLRDILAEGGATFNTHNSTDVSGNSGWNISIPKKRNLFWVGDAGNWNEKKHWALVSNGSGGECIPTPFDNVFFDENSFSQDNDTININTQLSFCNNMSWEGAKYHPSIKGHTLKLFGSLNLISEMNWIGVSIDFEATDLGKTITLAGQKLGNVYFNGIGGGWNFLDEFYSLYFYQYNGIINTNSKIVNSSGYMGVNGELNLGNSIFNIYQHSWKSEQIVILNSGTSTINFTNNSSQSLICYEQTFHDINFLKNGGIITGTGNIHFNDVFFEDYGYILPNSRTTATATFNNVLFTDYAVIQQNITSTFNKATFLNKATINTNNTYNTLSFTSGFEYILKTNTKQTIFNDLIAIGNCEETIFIHSSVQESPALIHKETVTVNCEYLLLQDITAEGGAIFNATNSTDLGGNTGWNIQGAAPRNLFWIGDTGNWSDRKHWSLSSNGSGGECIPTPYDNVFFDENSFSQIDDTVYTDSKLIFCNNMSWLRAKFNPTFIGNPLKLFGSISLISDMNWGGVSIDFEATDLGKTITLAGQKLGNVYFNGIGGGWNFLDEFYSLYFYQYNGVINTNSKIVNSSGYLGVNGELNLGNSIFNIYQNSWKSEQKITLNAGTSTINFISNSSHSLTCYEQIFHNINFLNGGGAIYGTGNIHFNDVFFGNYGYILPNSRTSAIANFNNVLFTDYALINRDITSTFNKLTFLNKATIRSNNIYDTLIFAPGFTYIFDAHTMQTINEGVQLRGNNCFPIILQSSIKNAPAYIGQRNGVVICDYLELIDVHAVTNDTLNASYYAGGYSSGDNANGWIFENAPGYIYGLGEDVTICKGDRLLTFNFNGGISYEWDDGSTEPSRVIEESGTYWVIVTYAEECWFKDEINITVLSNALVDIGEDITVCHAGTPIQLYPKISEGVEPYEFKWKPESAFDDPTSLNPTIRPDITSEYIFTVINNNDCEAYDTIKVFVMSTYKPFIYKHGNGYIYCSDKIKDASYQWYINDIKIPGAVHIRYFPIKTGSYTVEVFDKYGCASMASGAYEFKQGDYDSPAIVVGSNSANIGDSLTIPIYFFNNGLLVDAGITSLEAKLEFNKTLLYPQNPQGEFSVTDSTLIIPVHLEYLGELDTTNIWAKIDFVAYLGNAESTELNLIDIVGTDPAALSIIPGSFQLENLCQAGGVQLVENRQGIRKIFPNPADDKLEILFILHEEGKLKIELFSLEGQRLHTIIDSEDKEKGILKYNIDISKYPATIYTLYWETQSEKGSKQFVIER